MVRSDHAQGHPYRRRTPLPPGLDGIEPLVTDKKVPFAEPSLSIQVLNGILCEILPGASNSLKDLLIKTRLTAGELAAVLRAEVVMNATPTDRSRHGLRALPFYYGTVEPTQHLLPRQVSNLLSIGSHHMKKTSAPLKTHTDPKPATDPKAPPPPTGSATTSTPPPNKPTPPP